MNLFRKLPPSVSAKIFYLWIVVGSTWRFLTATIWGLLFLAIFLYWWSRLFGDVTPWTTVELIQWLSTLSGDLKVAVVSSLLTIFGFLVAFHTANLNWKHQARAQMKAQAAEEIEAFFSEASRLATAIEIHAKLMGEAVNLIQNQPTSPETEFKVKYVLDQTQSFVNARARLSAMAIEVHRIQGRHYYLLSTAWGAVGRLQEATAAFEDITRSMWFRIPFMREDDPALLVRFLAQVNVSELLAYITSYSQNYSFISGMAGSIRGQLLAPVIGFNFSSLFWIVSRRKEFGQSITEFYESRRNRD